MKNFCFVQLVPKDMRNKESINLGFEIIKNKIIEYGWNLDVITFGEKIDSNKYNIIGFNIFYVTHQLNLIPFLKQNNIEPLSEKRNKPLLIAGGQGILNPKPISKFIDIFGIGDGEETIIEILKAYENNNLENLQYIKGLYYPKYKNKIEFSYIDKIDSKPVIKDNQKYGMIELTRGCKNRCKFCQYAYTNGKYREKNLSLVKAQIQEIQSKNINNINFMSIDLGGYNKIKDLLEYCIEKEIRIMNTDIRINNYKNIAELLNKLKVRTLKVGIESFCEKTRKSVNKEFSNEQLDEFINIALENNISNLHFYLIWGLPEEDKTYEDWFYYIKYLKEKIKDIKRNIRLEYSITNFEPSLYTPYENIGFIDFNEKNIFLEKYLKVLEENGYILDSTTKCHANMHGRIGRKEESYFITMWLLYGDESLCDILLNLDINGISRTINKKFYNKVINLCQNF